MKIDFVKTLEASSPYTPGRIYFEESTSLIKVATASNQYRVFGGVRSADYDSSTDILTILNGNGDEVYIDFSQYVNQDEYEDDQYVISVALTELNNNISSISDDVDYLEGQVSDMRYGMQELQNSIENFYFVNGTSSQAGNSTSGSYLSTKWEGQIQGGAITQVYDGLKIAYRIKTNTGVSTAGVVLSIDGTNYYPVVIQKNTIVTTHYPVGSTPLMVFNSTQTAIAYLTSNTKTTVTGCWQIMEYDSNTNTYQREYVSSGNVEYPITTRYNTTSGESYYAEYGRYSEGVTLNPSTNTITASGFKITSGTSSQFLKADGTVDSNSYITSSDIPAMTTDSSVSAWGYLKANDVSTKVDKSNAVSSLSLAMNSSTYTITLSGTMADGSTFTVGNPVDLPLETMVVDGSYNSSTKKVSLGLKNGSSVEFSVADLVAGLQTEITSSNKLSADLIQDGTTNKVVTATDKNKWNNLVSNVQADWNATTGLGVILNKPTIPAAVTESTVSGWGFTKNTGTLTGVNFNGVDASVTNGVASITAPIDSGDAKVYTIDVSTSINNIFSDSFNLNSLISASTMANIYDNICHNIRPIIRLSCLTNVDMGNGVYDFPYIGGQAIEEWWYLCFGGSYGDLNASENMFKFIFIMYTPTSNYYDIRLQFKETHYLETSRLITSWNSTPSDYSIPSEKLVYNTIQNIKGLPTPSAYGKFLQSYYDPSSNYTKLEWRETDVLYNASSSLDTGFNISFIAHGSFGDTIVYTGGITKYNFNDWSWIKITYPVSGTTVTENLQDYLDSHCLPDASTSFLGRFAMVRDSSNGYYWDDSEDILSYNFSNDTIYTGYNRGISVIGTYGNVNITTSEIQKTWYSDWSWLKIQYSSGGTTINENLQDYLDLRCLPAASSENIGAIPSVQYTTELGYHWRESGFGINYSTNYIETPMLGGFNAISTSNHITLTGYELNSYYNNDWSWITRLYGNNKVTLQSTLDLLAPKASPAFTGTPTAPTANTNTNNTQIATTAFVKSVLPTVNNGTLTIQKNGTTVTTFTANQSGNATANITVNELPTVTTSDNGKILKVVSGAWAAASPITVYSGSNAPNNSTGIEGDIYIQS